MALDRILKITYKDQLKKKGTFIVRDVKDPDATGDDKLLESDVQDLCKALYDNRAMFGSKQPYTIEAAEIVITRTDDYDVSQVEDGDYEGGGGD